MGTAWTTMTPYLGDSHLSLGGGTSQLPSHCLPEGLHGIMAKSLCGLYRCREHHFPTQPKILVEKSPALSELLSQAAAPHHTPTPRSSQGHRFGYWVQVQLCAAGYPASWGFWQWEECAEYLAPVPGTDRQSSSVFPLLPPLFLPIRLLLLSVALLLPPFPSLTPFIKVRVVILYQYHEPRLGGRVSCTLTSKVKRPIKS